MLKPHRVFSTTILTFLVPLVLGFIVLSITWLEIVFESGAAIQESFSTSGYHSPIFLALLLASGALTVLFRLAGKHLRYILALLNCVFGFLIVLNMVKFFDEPLVSVHSDIAEYTGLTGSEIPAGIIESFQVTQAPWFMFAVAFLMLVPAILTFLFAKHFPLPSRKYDRNETSDNPWQGTGADNEDSID